VLDLQDGPSILVGHSYGGAVISESGTHDSVAGLVCICAFAPDAGESVSTLLATLPPDRPVPPILPPVDGFLFLDREKFAASFAADVPAGEAAVMADSQVPWASTRRGGRVADESVLRHPAIGLRIAPGPASVVGGACARSVPRPVGVYWVVGVEYDPMEDIR
jgi:pimeloyl-ACP methyl ester carboxylesterase